MSAVQPIRPEPFPTRDLRAERDAMEAAVVDRARRHQSRLDAAERAGYAAGFDAGVAKGERDGYRSGVRYGIVVGICWAAVVIGAIVVAGYWSETMPLPVPTSLTT